MTTEREQLVEITTTLKHVQRVLDETHAQTVRTNGRVTRLEEWRIDQLAREDERRRVLVDVAKEEARKAAEEDRRAERLDGWSKVIIGQVVAAALAVATYLLWMQPA